MIKVRVSVGKQKKAKKRNMYEDEDENSDEGSSEQKTDECSDLFAVEVLKMNLLNQMTHMRIRVMTYSKGIRMLMNGQVIGCPMVYQTQLF